MEKAPLQVGLLSFLTETPPSFGKQPIPSLGRPIMNFLQQLKLCNAAFYFKKDNYTTCISKNVKKESTNKFHTLDYIIMSFLDFKYYIRDSTYHHQQALLIKMIMTLNNNNNKTTQLKSLMLTTTNINPSEPQTSKSAPVLRRNFLADNPAAIASYNKQISSTIKSYKVSNNNIHLNQDIITSILASSSLLKKMKKQRVSLRVKFSLQRFPTLQLIKQALMAQVHHSHTSHMLMLWGRKQMER